VTARSSLITVITLVVLAAACADDDGPAGEDGTLEGVTWVLQRGSVDELLAGAPADARVDLSLEGGEASGTSGCNQYGGSYEVDGSTITFGPLRSTEMACEPALMDLESAYLGALASVGEYELGPGRLELRGDGVPLRFDAEAAPQPLALIGTTWALEALGGDGDAVSSPLAGTEVTLVLEDDGSAAGNGGCNAFNTMFETDEASISFGAVASTKMACEPDVMEQEASVFGALEDAAAFEIVGDVLTLSDGDGAFLVSYRGA
jgi:heat shock protein HslJ